ncbi:c-type cytochrome [Sulfurimonas sp. MAG313]|nr:c-type cytochrome [Sulfurimonas sp. MAG313]MDF1879815.1 c-type cytochrome [Sulfurimonas sp. MAG313]
MKNTSVLMMIVVALGLMATSASADIKKGQKGYLKTCKKCHGNGTKGAAMKTQGEWEDLYANDATNIKAKHAGTKGEKFFKSKKFKKLAPHLKDFLFQYGSDSGNVPSCG